MQPRRGLQLLLALLRSAAKLVWTTRLGFVGREQRRRHIGREARLLCERLGPAFIKLGQLASVRPDLFAPETIVELEGLQDQVAVIPTDQIRSVLRLELGADPEQLFQNFEAEPVAAGSIAQIHRACLINDYLPVVGEPLKAGTPIAIKVLRPGIEKLISADLAFARRWAKRLGRIRALGRWRLDALVDEFSQMLKH